MGMKFINAKFFYNKNELIDENNYSYWWILMGNLKRYCSNLELTDGADRSEWSKLIENEKSYNIVSSSSVELNNAYICGIADTSAPTVVENEKELGSVVLTARGSNGNSIIPFTVGQDNQNVGHDADSLWLLALSGDLNSSNIQSYLFPFKIDGGASAATQKYDKANYDISVGDNCIPLIGYSVSSDDPINSINYSGFTVGSSVVTLSGLYSNNDNL